MEKTQLEKLARLARITVSEKELSGLQKDMEAILRYVSQIQDASARPQIGADSKQMRGDVVGVITIVMREDGEPHREGAYSEELLAEAPKTERGYVKVKKIL